LAPTKTSAFARVVTLAVGILLVWLNRRMAQHLRSLRDSLLRGLEAVREPQTES
jgi:hypothetical protein